MFFSPDLKAIDGIIKKGNKTVPGSFIGVSLGCDGKAFHEFFDKTRKKIINLQFNILKEIAAVIADNSPVYSGYYVKNWKVTPNAPDSTSIGPWIWSGNQKRKMKVSEAEAVTLRQEAKERMISRLESGLNSESGNMRTKNNWYFTNRTPYANDVEARHGVLQAAQAGAEIAASLARMDGGM